MSFVFTVAFASSYLLPEFSFCYRSVFMANYRLQLRRCRPPHFNNHSFCIYTSAWLQQERCRSSNQSFQLHSWSRVLPATNVSTFFILLNRIFTKKDKKILSLSYFCYLTLYCLQKSISLRNMLTKFCHIRHES